MSSTRRRASDVHKDVACCLLRTSRGDGQCVIAEDTTSTRGRHVLITNHHVLPSREGIKDCSLVLGTKNLKLKVERLYSCCGPDSAWTGTSIHVPLPEKEEVGCCPRREDWTVVILDKDFARELASTHRMTFPRFCVCDRGAVNTDVSLFERLESGQLKLHPVAIQPPGVPENREACIKHDVQDYVSRSRLRYPFQVSGDIGPGCSGAPIFAMAGGTNTLSLLGIHCTSPGPDSSDAYHVGLSIDFIMSSLYCGGLEIGCSLVPTLAFLKDMIQKTNALPPAVVLDRVSHSIECYKNDQCVQLERLQSISISAEWQEEKRKVLLCNLGILEFVMTEIKMILSESFNLASSSDGLPVMKLLTALFSLFDGFERSGICAIVRSSENGGATLESRICQLCEKLLVVLKNNRQATHLVKAIFAMISPLLNYSYDDGPACCLLETPNVRIFRTISQSAAAKTDVSTLEACYTAYLKTLEFAHQDDMARAGLEGEQRLELARREGEERFETMKKEAEQLKCTLAQQAVQEEGLLSELDEARQKNEELKTKCENQVLALEQLRGIEERCAQLAADKDSLNEENEELARELNERKKEIKELQHELLLLQQPKEVEACGTHINPLECCVQPSATPCALSGADTFSLNCHLMDDVINEIVFLDLCKTSAVNNWKFVGRRLGISDVTINTLYLDEHHNGLKEVFYKLLKQWKLEKGNGATYRELTKALEEENLFDAIQVVQLHVKTEVQVQVTEFHES